MNTTKMDKLRKAGWNVGEVDSFLGLTPQEYEYVSLKAELAQALSDVRKQQKLSQQQVADLVGSSQSRVAKMEVADPSVSLDLIIKSLLGLGMSRSEMAKRIARAER